jgi:hypothetical protein
MSKTADAPIGPIVPPSLGAIGAEIGANSRMHDRWLRSGMGVRDDKWYKSAAWCKSQLN